MRRPAPFRAVASLMLIIAFAPLSVASAQSGVADELAYSDETGYFFFWDPALLSLVKESTEPGTDHWRFSDGEATVDVWAYAASGVTGEACVRDILARLTAYPATASLEALPAYGGGPPEIDGRIRIDFVLTIDQPGGRDTYAAQALCQEVVPGESLAFVFVHMPARVYNERVLDLVEVFGADFLLYANLHGATVQASEIESVPIPDQDGTTAGTMRGFQSCSSQVFDVLVRATDRSIVVDPASLVAIDPDGVTLPLSAVAWSLPEAQRETALDLEPGQSGLLHAVVDVGFDRSFDLYYTAPNGETIYVASSATGCGAGGAAPVPIDID